MFRRFVISFAATASVLAAVAPARAAEPAPVQLLQPGDSTMSCQALATEINALTIAEAKPKKKKGGFGGFGKMLSMAAPMLGGMGGSGMGGALATQAMGMAQQGAMEASLREQTDAAMAAANPTQSVEAQRKARLMGFFTQKGC